MVEEVEAPSRWRLRALSVLGWGLLAASLPPVSATPLAFCGLVPWLWTLMRRDERGMIGACLVGQWVAGIYHFHWAWVLPGPVGPGVVFVMSLVYLIAVAPAAWILRWWVCRQNGPIWLAVPLTLTAVDASREWLTTGISWATPGYALGNWPAWAQLAEVGRVWPLSLLCYGTCALLAEAAWMLRRRDRGDRAGALRRLLVVATLLIAVPWWGSRRIDALEAEMIEGPRVLGLQLGVSQVDKLSNGEDRFQRRFATITRLIEEGTRAHPDTDLVVFPETSLDSTDDTSRPFEVRRRLTLDEALNARRRSTHTSLARVLFDATAGCRQTPLFITGHVTRDDVPPGGRDELGDGVRTRNTAVLSRPDGPRLAVVGQYHKRELVPIGETLPAWLPGRRRLMQESIHTVGFAPAMTRGEGSVLWDIESADGETFSFATHICFEAIFPGYFREASRDGADFVVSISNDAWYLDSAELDLMHLHTRMRAIESRRSVVRVSNTGITTVIDPMGREFGVVEVEGDRKAVEGWLSCRVPILRMATPWVQWGDFVAWAVVAGAALSALGTAFFNRLRRVKLEADDFS